MWYLCGSESLSVRCTLPAGDKHVVIVKSDHYITYQLVFLSNSQIRSCRAYSLDSKAYLLVIFILPFVLQKQPHYVRALSEFADLHFLAIQSSNGVC